MWRAVSRQLPPRKIAPWLGLGFGVGVEAIFLGGNCPRTMESISKKTQFQIKCIDQILRLHGS